MPTVAEAASAIRSRFAAEFPALRPGVAIRYDNVSAAPPDGAPWVNLTVEPGEGEQVSIGAARRWRQAGTVRVRVFAPPGEGGGEALAIADDAASLFRGVSEAGVRFGAPGLTRIGPGRRWYELQVAVPWTAHLDA